MINLPWHFSMDSDLSVHLRLFLVPAQGLSKTHLAFFLLCSFSVHHASVDFVVTKIGPWLQLGMLPRQPRSLSATRFLETKQHILSNVFDFPTACRCRPRSNKYTRSMHKHISYKFKHGRVHYWTCTLSAC